MFFLAVRIRETQKHNLRLIKGAMLARQRGIKMLFVSNAPPPPDDTQQYQRFCDAGSRRGVNYSAWCAGISRCILGRRHSSPLEACLLMKNTRSVCVCVCACSCARPAIPGISYVRGRQMRCDCGGRATAELHLASCIFNTLRCAVSCVVLCFLCVFYTELWIALKWQNLWVFAVQRNKEAWMKGNKDPHVVTLKGFWRSTLS